MIDNTNDDDPLIYGDFDTDLVKINKLLKLNPIGAVMPPTCDNVSFPQNTGIMYMDDRPLSLMPIGPARLMYCDGTTYVPLN